MQKIILASHWDRNMQFRLTGPFSKSLSKRLIKKRSHPLSTVQLMWDLWRMCSTQRPDLFWIRASSNASHCQHLGSVTLATCKQRTECKVCSFIYKYLHELALVYLAEMSVQVSEQWETFSRVLWSLVWHCGLCHKLLASFHSHFVSFVLTLRHFCFSELKNHCLRDSYDCEEYAYIHFSYLLN